MSNETKRDVVEAILLAKDTGTIWDSSTVRYYLNRYDAALPDETDEQKACIYCHNKHFKKISQESYSFWYRNKRFKPEFCGHCGRKL